MLRRALGFFWPLDDGQGDRKSRLKRSRSA
jgi:hypothetical protein